MKNLIFFLVALSSCAYDPYITRRANTRIRAADRLENCLGWRIGVQPTEERKQSCLKESREFCVSEGLEPGCGIDDLWGRIYTPFPFKKRL